MLNILNITVQHLQGDLKALDTQIRAIMYFII